MSLPDQPLVSVVLPTHDRADRVGAAVASAQRQTWEGLELVVVDDASTDATPGVLEGLAAGDDRVRVLRNDRALGPAGARNTGLDAASGDVVAFLDDDDEWAPEKVERQLAFLRTYPDVGLVACWYDIVRPGAGRPIAHRGVLRCDEHDLLWDDFVGGASVAAWRRDAFPTEPRFDPDLPTCEDWDAWLSCARHAGVATVAQPLCRYLVHDAHASHDAALAEGRRRFVAKHRAAMDADCLAYHEARIALLAGGAPTAARAALHLARRSRRAAWALASASVAGRIGDALGDPGRGPRRLHRVVAR